MTEQRKTTREKLAEALEQVNAPREMIKKARSGDYDDYLSDSEFPIADLVRDARTHGLTSIVEQALSGDFDGRKWEARYWAQSSDG